MNHRTPLFALLVAGAFAAPAAFAQDATGASQPSPPASTVQADASAQQSTSADASAAASDQGMTSGDAGMATSASSAQPEDPATTGDQGKDQQDKDAAQPPSKP